MDNLDEKGTADFITHCLKDAGVTSQIFSEQAIKYIYDICKGGLRLTVNLAAQALIQASKIKQANVQLLQVQEAETLSMLPKMEFTL